ncbi:MAG: DUF1947 domain-containing protein [Candidatus Bathyarchaeia archaeon]
MPEKYQKHFLKEKEAKNLLSEASEKLTVDLNKIFRGKVNVEASQTEFVTIFWVNAKPILAKTEHDFFPTLLFEEFFAVAPKIVVDMGAVPFICKGANVMAPGVRGYRGEFRKGDYVFVVDEKHGKALAVAEAMLNSGEAAKAKQGVVARNVHFVSDRIWDLLKSL